MRNPPRSPVLMPRELNIRIQRAAPADVSAVLKIEESSFGKQAWNRECFLSYFARKSTLFLIARSGLKIVGYAIATNERGKYELDSIAVAPKARGRRVATKLFSRLNAIGRKRGAASLTLMVRHDNHPAIELYRKLGFSRVRRVNGYYEDGSPAWRMRIEI